MKFTNVECLELLKNPNVVKCSNKAITYSKEFKLKAVKQYIDEYISSNEIFRLSGFNITVIGKHTPEDRIDDWKRLYRLYGEEGLSTDRRGKHGNGGRPTTKNLTEKEKLERLESQVAYLKAENDFLKQLRAKRAE
jgi:transposase-like protein